MAATSLPGGFVGVDVFFVLSGFLITTLLVRERTATGAVSIPAFYTRRALRLFPALLVAIVLAVVLGSTLATKNTGRSTLKGLPWVVFYSSDFAEASHVNLGLLGHTWSLAIEEQFYLVWPWVLLFICRARRRLGLVAKALALLAVLDMMWSTHLALTAGHDRAYFSLDGHAMGLLGGAALALVWNGAPEWRPTSAIKRLLQSTAGASVLGIVLAAVVLTPAANQVSLAISVSTVLTVVLIPILLGVPEGPIHRVFSSAPAVWIGKRSYGLYLYNQIVFYTFVPLRPHSKLVDVMCLLATFAIAALSYKFVEEPFLRRKDRIRARSMSGHSRPLATST
jgi:peptidoglycan/LPS O-acetylase OafA/YrhL